MAVNEAHSGSDGAAVNTFFGTRPAQAGVGSPDINIAPAAAA
jgi:hypothetical protein